MIVLEIPGHDEFPPPALISVLFDFCFVLLFRIMDVFDFG